METAKSITSKSFILLLSQENMLDTLLSINKMWCYSLFNHYNNSKPYLTKENIPFYIKDYDKIFDKILNKELFGSLLDIYSLYIPYYDKDISNISYPIHYTPLPIKNKKELIIYKYVKNNRYKLKHNFDKYLLKFNADIIYLLEYNDKYYIIDYEFKHTLMCYTLKYNFIKTFCQAYSLDYLPSYIIFSIPDNLQSGIIIEKDDDKFLDKKLIIKG